MNKDEIETLEADINLCLEEIRKKSVDIASLQGRLRELFYILKKRQERLDE